VLLQVLVVVLLLLLVGCSCAAADGVAAAAPGCRLQGCMAMVLSCCRLGGPWAECPAAPCTCPTQHHTPAAAAAAAAAAAGGGKCLNSPSFRYVNAKMAVHPVAAPVARAQKVAVYRVRQCAVGGGAYTPEGVQARYNAVNVLHGAAQAALPPRELLCLRARSRCVS
jgi:hypothetical protein